MEEKVYILSVCEIFIRNNPKDYTVNLERDKFSGSFLWQGKILIYPIKLREISFEF